MTTFDPTEREGFRFRGGSPALDLTATVKGRMKSSPEELMRDPSDLARWFVSSGLVAILPKVTQKDLVLARALREAIFLLANQHEDRMFDPSALDVINQAAMHPPAAPKLRCDGTVELEPSARGLLSLLAREAIRLFARSDRHLIRKCQSPTCAIIFVDKTRSGDRRWCSMSACGNKAKVSDFRKRKRNPDT